MSSVNRDTSMDYGYSRRSMMSLINNDDNFARMVAEEVKNKLSPLHKKELMRTENWGRWRDALIALSDNLQRQIDNIEADAESDNRRFSAMGRDGMRLGREAQQHYGERAVKVKRFKFHVDKRLDEVMAMIETGDSIKSDGWEQVEFLRRSIAKHRSMIHELDLDDTDIDRALWSALDGKWDFDSIDVNNI